MRYLIYFFGLIASFSVQATTAIEHWVNYDGVSIYLVEAKTIPMVDVQVDWPVGSASDPRLKVGLEVRGNNLSQIDDMSGTTVS